LESLDLVGERDRNVVINLAFSPGVFGRLSGLSGTDVFDIDIDFRRSMGDIGRAGHFFWINDAL